MIPANQHLRIAIGLFILLINLPLHAFEELEEFPPDLVGTWVYETGDEKLDGCNISRIVVNSNLVRVFKDCVDGDRSVISAFVEGVLVDRAFFSDTIVEYHILTDGPNVVFNMLSNPSTASIYLQFWVTDQHGPTRQLGVFNLR